MLPPTARVLRVGLQSCETSLCRMAASVVTRQVGITPGFPCVLQGLMEGGFMGRTNKLVDGCYSYWQGALFPLLQQLWPLYMRQLGLPRAPPLPKESAPLPAPPMEAAIPSLPIAAQPPPQQAAAEAKRMQVQHGPSCSGNGGCSLHACLCMLSSAHWREVRYDGCALRRTWRVWGCQ